MKKFGRNYYEIVAEMIGNLEPQHGKKPRRHATAIFSERRKKKKKYIGIFFDVFVQKREIGSLPLLNRNSGRAADLL